MNSLLNSVAVCDPLYHAGAVGIPHPHPLPNKNGLYVRVERKTLRNWLN